MSTSTCYKCGRFLDEDSECIFDDEIYCRECLDRITVVCVCCGNRIYREDNEGNSVTPLCEHCREAYYTSCARCGELLYNEDACYISDSSDTPYCALCIEDLRDTDIHNYSYKPTPVFHGKGSRFFGVELEIDEAGECDSNAASILYIANDTENNIYCKHDGSLNDGFEIVTHPMTLDYHLHSMPWEAVLDKARELGYYSHQAHTCGLHVHINRTAFGEDTVAQDSAIARILYFLERNWNELLQFSRRTQRQLERWAARYGYKDTPAEILEHAKKGRADRYTCVNITNRDTIEFRIFRGTLKYNTLIATLQMVNRICDMAYFLSDAEMRNLSWPAFVAGVNEPELIQYLKERRLYVSDPVESEEEI